MKRENEKVVHTNAEIKDSSQIWILWICVSSEPRKYWRASGRPSRKKKG